MKSFQQLADQALNLHPSMTLEQILGTPALDANTLAQVSDDRCLSAMTWRIFCAGLKRSLVDGKWPDFEKAFFGFVPEKVALMSDEQLENLMQNRALIRHFGKIKATRVNALMVEETSRKAGGFGRFLSDWPVEETHHLFTFLKKNGSQLGGNSGAYCLRIIGRDTYVLTDDVVTALKAQGVIDKRPTAQRDLQLVQETFNELRTQSGYHLCQLSRLLAYSIG